MRTLGKSKQRRMRSELGSDQKEGNLSDLMWKAADRIRNRRGEISVRWKGGMVRCPDRGQGKGKEASGGEGVPHLKGKGRTTFSQSKQSAGGRG